MDALSALRALDLRVAEPRAADAAPDAVGVAGASFTLDVAADAPRDAAGGAASDAPPTGTPAVAALAIPARRMAEPDIPTASPGTAAAPRRPHRLSAQPEREAPGGDRPPLAVTAAPEAGADSRAAREIGPRLPPRGRGEASPDASAPASPAPPFVPSATAHAPAAQIAPPPSLTPGPDAQSPDAPPRTGSPFDAAPAVASAAGDAGAGARELPDPAAPPAAEAGRAPQVTLVGDEHALAKLREAPPAARDAAHAASAARPPAARASANGAGTEAAPAVADRASARTAPAAPDGLSAGAESAAGAAIPGAPVAAGAPRGSSGAAFGRSAQGAPGGLIDPESFSRISPDEPASAVRSAAATGSPVAPVSAPPREAPSPGALGADRAVVAPQGPGSPPLSADLPAAPTGQDARVSEPPVDAAAGRAPAAPAPRDFAPPAPGPTPPRAAARPAPGAEPAPIEPADAGDAAGAAAPASGGSAPAPVPALSPRAARSPAPADAAAPLSGQPAETARRTEALETREAEPGAPAAPARQIAQAIVAAGADGRVEIRLDPPELGAVGIDIRFEDGGVSANVTAERPETLELIRRNVEALQRDLAAAGFARADVSFGDRGFAEGRRDAPQPEARPAAEPAREAPPTVPPRRDWLSAGPRDRLDIRL